MSNDKEIPVIDIFWKNVAWHLENKGLTFRDLDRSNGVMYSLLKSNITLNKVQVIADILDIDDYAILFED